MWRHPNSQRSDRGLVLVALLLLLAVLATAIAKRSPQVSSLAGPNVQEETVEIYYPNCAAARAAGAAPIPIGEPGYRPQLDADHDGIACEPWRR